MRLSNTIRLSKKMRLSKQSKVLAIGSIGFLIASSVFIADRAFGQSPSQAVVEPSGADLELRKVDSKGFKETQGPETQEKYLLRYKFEPGTVLRSEVLHLSKNGTRINSVLQEASSRTLTEKSWHVVKTDQEATTFEYRVDEIELAQQFGQSEEIRYSTKEAGKNAQRGDGKEPAEKPPVQFASAVETAGKTISTIQIDHRGMVVARSDSKDPPHMGMGDITMPLPADPVGVGATWEVPREMRIDRKDGSSRLIKFRELFKLEKVSAGVATVDVRSEPLSAIADPAEEAQVMQQLSNGTIQFDIDAGRMISKELAWDHQVVAFSGPGSVLEYSARLEDHVVSAKVEPRTAANNRTNTSPAKSVPAQSSAVKSNPAKPNPVKSNPAKGNTARVPSSNPKSTKR